MIWGDDRIWGLDTGLRRKDRLQAKLLDPCLRRDDDMGGMTGLGVGYWPAEEGRASGSVTGSLPSQG